MVKKAKWQLLLLLTVFISLFSISGWAETDFPTGIKEVVIYTDGLGFIVREGEVTTDYDGEYLLHDLPMALKGSLHVYSKDPSVFIEQVTTYQEDQITQLPIADREEFFRQNEGKSIQLLTKDGAVMGEISGFLKPDLLAVRVTHENGVTSDNLYPLTEITGFYLLEPAVMAREVTEKVGRLRVKTGGTSMTSSFTLGMTYLQSGIDWDPEYTLDLQSNERGGALSFSAVVQNDLVDIIGSTVYLAEDGPQFSREVSPLVVFAVDAQGFAPASVYRAEVTGRGVLKSTMDLAPGAFEEYIPSLLMYKKSAVTLKKGERAILPIFQGVVRVEPIYRLELSRDLYTSELREEPIWKGYRVYNDSAMHWVAGNVLVRMGDKPLSLQKFPFIAPQSSGEIKVMTEKSILAEVTEMEFERIQDALTHHNRQYSSIQVRGEIKLLNTKNEEVIVNVSHLIPGEVSEVSDGAAVTKKVNPLAGPNPQTEVVWEVPVQAQGVKYLTYVYQTYVGF